jgi:hypothetical protein
MKTWKSSAILRNNALGTGEGIVKPSGPRGPQGAESGFAEPFPAAFVKRCLGTVHLAEHIR